MLEAQEIELPADPAGRQQTGREDDELDTADLGEFPDIGHGETAGAEDECETQCRQHCDAG